MKVISQDASSLVAKDHAYGGLIFGIAFIVVGALVALLLHSSTVVTLIGVALLVLGIIAVLTRKVRTLEVNKGTGQVTFTMKSIIKSATKNLAISDIEKVQFFQMYQQNFDGGARTSAKMSEMTKVLLVAKNGEQLDLADGQKSMSSFGMFTSPPNEKTGRQVAEFLGVQFEQTGAPSLGQVAQTITGAMQSNVAPSVVAQNPAPAQPAQTPPATTTPPAPDPTTPPAAQNPSSSQEPPQS